MSARLQLLLVVVALPLFIGCSQRLRLDSDYALVTPERLNPDGHPGTALHFKGKVVWPNVYTGAGTSLREGVFVFSAPVPSNEGQYDYSLSPQLFAITGDGPPVIITQRITADALDSPKRHLLWQITPAQNGVRAEFEFWADREHRARMVREISWANIKAWLREAEALPPRNTPLGTYRLLPITTSNTK